MWYAVNLLFSATRGLSEHDPALWEESVRLISAESESEARMKAEYLGGSQRVSYAVEGADLLTWEFIRVERIFAITADKLEDGTELFSRYLRDSEVISLLTPFSD